MDRKTPPEDSEKGLFTSLKARKTLVEYCTNDWQKEKKGMAVSTSALAGFDEERWYDKYLDLFDDYYDNCLSIVKAPKFRRLVVTVTCAILFTWMLWTWFLWPFIEEERAVWDTFNTYNINTSTQLFGTNARPRLGGLIQTKDLDSSLLPGGPNASRSRRLIFIGDIHGCKNELLELLEKVKFDDARDHIVSVGDIVTKGPDSLGVIELLRERKASVVRGNQDDRVILLAEQHRRHARGEDVEDITTRGSRKHDLKAPEGIARALSKDQLEWLQSFPLILKVGYFKKIGEVIAVHGGLVPGLALNAQDPVAIMNMRSIDLKTHVPSKLHHDKHKGSKPWYKIWGKYQRLLPAMTKWNAAKGSWPGLVTTQLTAIYGHDARTGLQISRFSKGLDTNCARGGQLTALVLDDRGNEEIVQIQCHKDYTARH